MKHCSFVYEKIFSHCQQEGLFLCLECLLWFCVEHYDVLKNKCTDDANYESEQHEKALDTL